MIELSNEVNQEWIKLGLMTNDGKRIPYPEQVKNGTSLFFLNSFDNPYTYDSLNVDALSFNYEEYLLFREYFLNIAGIDLNNQFDKRYTLYFSDEVASKIGFCCCNIGLPNSNKFTSVEKQKECMEQKAKLLEKLRKLLK